MSTCHALLEAKIQLLDKKAYSVLYYYKEQKIISHLRGIVCSNSTAGYSDGFSLPSNEEAEQEESHTQAMDFDTRTQVGWSTAEASLQKPSSTSLPGPAWKHSTLSTKMVLVSSKIILQAFFVRSLLKK